MTNKKNNLDFPAGDIDLLTRRISKQVNRIAALKMRVLDEEQKLNKLSSQYVQLRQQEMGAG